MNPPLSCTALGRHSLPFLSFRKPGYWKAARVVLVAGLLAANGFSHGTVVYPESRVYRIYQSNPDNPSFQLAANAVAMDGTLSYYTWNEVSRMIPAAVQAGLPPGFDYSPWIPDGQLGSAGRVDPNSNEYPRTYMGLDQVSPDWPKTPVVAGETITVDFLATAPHDPSVWDVWMTKADWNPNMPLTWEQMEFLGRPQATLAASHYTFDLTIPRDRSGHHVLYVIWQRDDPAGEAFFSTSDIEVQPPKALYPGSNDDLILSSGTNGVLSSAPPADEKTVSNGQVWTVELSSPGGSFVGQPRVFLARELLPGDTLDSLFGLPDVYLHPVEDVSILPGGTLSAGGDAVSWPLPVSSVGRTFLFQGGVFSASALNGAYASTDVHVLHVVP